MAFRKYIMYVFSDGLPLLLGMVFLRILIVSVPSDELGNYVIGLTIAMAVSAVLGGWVNQTMNRFLAFDARPSIDTLRYIFAFVGYAAVTSFIVSESIMLLRNYHVNKNLFPVQIGMVGALAALLCFQGASQAFFQAQLKAKYHALIAFVGAGFRVLALLLFIAWLDIPLTANSVLIIYILSLIIIEFVSIGLGKNLISYDSGDAPSSRKTIISFALPYLPFFLGYNILNSGDRYIIEWLRGSYTLVSYSIHYTIATAFISILLSPLNLLMQPLLSQTGEVYILRRILRMVTSAGVILLSLLTIFGDYFVRVYTDGKYTPAGGSSFVLLMVAVGTIFWQLSIHTQRIFDYNFKTIYSALGICIAMIFNIIINLLLVNPFGMNGAAFATCISYLLLFVLYIYWGRVTLGISDILLLVMLLSMCFLPAMFKEHINDVILYCYCSFGIVFGSVMLINNGHLEIAVRG